MKYLGFSLLASVAVNHCGLKSITVDGTVYPPFDSRIDSLLESVRRIEWSHDVSGIPFSPITNVMSPALACQPNPRAPLLKAVARAGAEVSFNWTVMVRMHLGPILTYLGELPSPDTKPQDVKFFTIDENGFNRTLGKWANEIAADNGESYQVQLPNDIKFGNYILRTELLALHGNATVENRGSVQPEGVNIPGAYKKTDLGIAYNPYQPLHYNSSARGYIADKAESSEYIFPGPPLYKGRYSTPKGQPLVVPETGAYTGEVKDLYEATLKSVEEDNHKIIDFVNQVWWKDNKIDMAGAKNFGAMVQNMVKERGTVEKELQGLKTAIQDAEKQVAT